MKFGRPKLLQFFVFSHDNGKTDIDKKIYSYHIEVKQGFRKHGERSDKFIKEESLTQNFFILV